MQISELIPWNRDKNKAPATDDGRSDNPLAALQRDINQVFEDFWQQADTNWIGRTNALDMFGPSTDVSETEDSIEVAVELPGMSEEDIDLSLSGDAMTLRGEKKIEREDKRKGVYMSERSYGAFYRTIPLPPGVDADKAEAKFERGVLTVTFPKSPEAEAKVKRITVKGA